MSLLSNRNNREKIYCLNAQNDNNSDTFVSYSVLEISFSILYIPLEVDQRLTLFIGLLTVSFLTPWNAKGTVRCEDCDCNVGKTLESSSGRSVQPKTVLFSI